MFWFWLLTFVVWSVWSNFCRKMLSSVLFSSGEKQYFFIFMIIQVPKNLLSRPLLLAKMNLWDPTDPPNLLFYRVTPVKLGGSFPDPRELCWQKTNRHTNLDTPKVCCSSCVLRLKVYVYSFLKYCVNLYKSTASTAVPETLHILPI